MKVINNSYCSIEFGQLEDGTVFSLSYSSDLYMKIEEICDEDDCVYDAVNLSNGGITCVADEHKVVVYKNAAVVTNCHEKED